MTSHPDESHFEAITIEPPKQLGYEHHYGANCAKGLPVPWKLSWR